MNVLDVAAGYQHVLIYGVYIKGEYVYDHTI